MIALIRKHLFLSFHSNIQKQRRDAGYLQISRLKGAKIRSLKKYYGIDFSFGNAAFLRQNIRAVLTEGQIFNFNTFPALQQRNDQFM